MFLNVLPGGCLSLNLGRVDVLFFNTDQFNTILNGRMVYSPEFLPP